MRRVIGGRGKPYPRAGGRSRRSGSRDCTGLSRPRRPPQRRGKPPARRGRFGTALSDEGHPREAREQQSSPRGAEPTDWPPWKRAPPPFRPPNKPRKPEAVIGRNDPLISPPGKSGRGGKKAKPRATVADTATPPDNPAEPGAQKCSTPWAGARGILPAPRAAPREKKRGQKRCPDPPGRPGPTPGPQTENKPQINQMGMVGQQGNFKAHPPKERELEEPQNGRKINERELIHPSGQTVVLQKMGIRRRTGRASPPTPPIPPSLPSNNPPAEPLS